MSKSAAYLIVDDDADVLRAARLALSGPQRTVATLGGLTGIEARLAQSAFDVVLLDMNFAAGNRSGDEGLDGLARIHATDPTISVVLMTVYGSVTLAVEALKRGAVDFILKPWRNDKLSEAVEAAAALASDRRTARDDLNLDQVEREAIARALERHAGNVTRAASALGLTRPALYRRIAKHEL